MHPDRRPLIAGNWKMNGSLDSTTALIDGIVAGLPRGPEVAVLPPFAYLVPARDAIASAVDQALGDVELRLGAQDLSARPPGAHTGDIAAAMLVDCGASLVLSDTPSAARTTVRPTRPLNNAIKATKAISMAPMFTARRTPSAAPTAAASMTLA